MEETFKNALNKNIQKIENIFKYKKELRRILNEQELKIIEKSFKIVMDQMNKICKQNEVRVGKQQYEDLKNVITILEDIIIERPIPRIIRDLIRELTLLLINWNRLSIKNGRIQQRLKLIRRVIEAKTTLDDVIYLTRQLLIKLKKEREYKPIGFELSKHYLLALEEDLKRK